MPELPEVEVLVRHLDPLLHGKMIRSVTVNRAKILRKTQEAEFTATLEGSRFECVQRRGKYMSFTLKPSRGRKPFVMVGHLGMTGRMYLQPSVAALPKHAAVVCGLGKENFVFEDTRYFGCMTLDTAAIDKLGPEPLTEDFTATILRAGCQRSAQPIKVKLLDQALVAGVGNIYASETLFLAGVSPKLSAKRLSVKQAERLAVAIQEVLARAIDLGSTIPLDFAGDGKKDGLFYYGSSSDANPVHERFNVYGREGKACTRCETKILRIEQAARSTFFCPKCQKAR